MKRISNTLRRRPYLFLFILSLLSSFLGTFFWNFIFVKLCRKTKRSEPKQQKSSPSRRTSRQSQQRQQHNKNQVQSTPTIDIPPNQRENASVPLHIDSDLIGKIAPDFNVKAVANNQFTSASLDDFENSYLILWFYPGDWQETSAAMLRKINSSYDDILKLNGKVAAVSIDSEFPHLKFSEVPSERGGLAPLHPEMLLLADNKQQLSEKYGMLDQSTGRSRQGMIVIGPDKTIRHVVVSANGFGCQPNDILAMLSSD